MKPIKLKTYNEIVCYKNCLVLLNNIPEINPNRIEEFFNHLKTPGNTLQITANTIDFMSGMQKVNTIQFNTKKIGDDKPYLSMTVSSIALKMVSNPKYRYSSGGDSGSSGNNNNNNNNNNNG